MKLELLESNLDKEVKIMPGFDQSGPMGAGPMTGGARGRCGSLAADDSRTLPRTDGFGRGLAYGRGFRGGRGNDRRIPWRYAGGYPVQPPPAVGNPTDELNRLRTEADLINNTLKTINNRITEIEKRI